MSKFIKGFGILNSRLMRIDFPGMHTKQLSAKLLAEFMINTMGCYPVTRAWILRTRLAKRSATQPRMKNVAFGFAGLLEFIEFIESN